MHQTKPNESDDCLVSPESFDSWLTLLEAARVRAHTSILEANELLCENEVPKIFYHRTCRCLFTMKRSLEALKRNAGERPTDCTDFVPKKSSRRSSSTESRV